MPSVQHCPVRMYSPTTSFSTLRFLISVFTVRKGKMDMYICIDIVCLLCFTETAEPQRVPLHAPLRDTRVEDAQNTAHRACGLKALLRHKPLEDGLHMEIK